MGRIRQAKTSQHPAIKLHEAERMKIDMQRLTQRKKYSEDLEKISKAVLNHYFDG